MYKSANLTAWVEKKRIDGQIGTENEDRERETDRQRERERESERYRIPHDGVSTDIQLCLSELFHTLHTQTQADKHGHVHACLSTCRYMYVYVYI